MGREEQERPEQSQEEPGSEAGGSVPVHSGGAAQGGAAEGGKLVGVSSEVKNKWSLWNPIPYFSESICARVDRAAAEGPGMGMRCEADPRRTSGKTEATPGPTACAPGTQASTL